MALETQKGPNGHLDHDEIVLDPLPSLLDLQNELRTKAHLLATNGDAQLSQAALKASKDIFDLGLQYELLSHPHLHPFIISVLEPPTVSLRSKSKAKEPSPDDERPDPAAVLPYTPLSELTVEGMDQEQIWAQLELRTSALAEVIKQVGYGEADDDDEEDGEDEESDEEEEEDSSEEMTEEEFRKMIMDRGEESDEEEDDDEESGDEDEDDEVNFRDLDGEDSEEEEEEEEEDDDEEEDDWEDESDQHDELSELADALPNGEGSSGEEDVEIDDGDEEDEDEDDEADDDHSESEEMEEENDDLVVDEEESEGVNILSDEGDEDDRAALFGDEPGPSKSRSKRQHPTLDDNFFSIDDFNRSTEEAEAARVSSGQLGGDRDDEDDEDLGEDIGDMMLHGTKNEDDPIMYSDFFEAPRGSKDRKGKGKGKQRATKSESRPSSKPKKGVRFADGDDEDDDGIEEDEEDPEDEDEDDEDGDDEDREVMGRFKGDLFDEDENPEQVSQNLSTHEKKQLALAKQIAELEQEAIGPKDWTLLGEATSRARPENSLLEEDLDFEQVAKVVPVVTEETVRSLEDLIKKRILEENYDSPVRLRAYEPTPFLPSRYFDLQDKQSSKSLAQIYEDEYQAASAGGKARDPRDEKLRKEHEEIDKLWSDICYKLDALSSLNFVPKAPKAQITTIDNLPTTSMESALPPTSAPTTILAPEELFAPPTTSNLVARSELDHEQAQAARLKRRRAKKGARQRLEEMAELYGKKHGKGGVRAEKDRALQSLVKSGKGVTVVGKGGSEDAKARKRSNLEVNGDGQGNSKRFKL